MFIIKKIYFIIILSISVFFLIASGCVSTQHAAAKVLNIDLSETSVISEYDTHSGNGDGTAYIQLHANNDKLLNQIKDNYLWKPLPMDEPANTLIYGISDETSRIGPFLSDSNGNALIPEIENGYYTLIDRHTQKDKEDNSDMLKRGSFNFTVGVYDMDTDTLYCCSFDT